MTCARAGFMAARILAMAAMVSGCVSGRLGRQPDSTAPVQAAAAPTPAPAATPQPTLAYPQALPMDESKPLTLRSDRLRYNDQAKETEFIGHVVARHDSTTLSAERLRTSTKGESAQVKGRVRLTDSSRKVELLAEEGDYSGALAEANLRGGVVLHSVDPYAVPVTVTGKTAWYHAASRLARMRGGVRVERGNLTATAARAELEGASDLLSLEEGVEAVMGSNRVRAGKVRMDGKTRSMSFEGQVEAVFRPKEVRDAASHPEKP